MAFIMADMADMLGKLLDDPGTMEKLQGLLGGTDKSGDGDGDALETVKNLLGGGARDDHDHKERHDHHDQDRHDHDHDDRHHDERDARHRHEDGHDGAALLPDGIDPAMLMKITTAFSKMNKKHDDKRTRLLYAIKPYLSKGRRGKVDSAAQILKLLSVMDLFGDDFKL